MQKKEKVNNLKKKGCIRSIVTVDTMIPEHWEDDNEFEIDFVIDNSIDEINVITEIKDNKVI